MQLLITTYYLQIFDMIWIWNLRLGYMLINEINDFINLIM